MKRYSINYFNKNSQYPKTTYCLGDSDLHATLVDLILEGNFIDLVGEKDELNTIGHFSEIKYRPILKELNVLEMNNKNEEIVYKAWGI